MMTFLLNATDAVGIRPYMGQGKWWALLTACKRCGFPLVDWCGHFGEDDEDEQMESYHCPHCGLNGWWVDSDIFLDISDYAGEFNTFDRACGWMRRGWKVSRKGWNSARRVCHREQDLFGKYNEITACFSQVIERLPICEESGALADLTDGDKGANDWFVAVKPDEVVRRWEPPA